MVGDVADRLAGVGWPPSNRSIAARTASGSSGCSARRRRVSRHSAALASAPSSVRNHGTNVTHHDAARTTDQLEHVVGDVAGARRRARGRSSGRRTPAPRETSIACRIVSSETCERSTSTPRRFSSRTTSSPNVVRPPCATLAGRRVGPRRVVVVRERQVAGAEPREDPQRAERASRSTGLPRRRSSRPPCPVAAIRSTSSAVRASSSRSGCARTGRTARRSARASASPRLRVGEVRRHVDRPELPSHASPLQAREIRVEARARARRRRASRPSQRAFRSAQTRSLCPSISGADRRSSTIRSRFWAAIGRMLPSRLPRGFHLVDRRRRVLVDGRPGSSSALGSVAGVVASPSPAGSPSPASSTSVTSPVPAPFLVVSETTFDGCADPPSFAATTR